MVKIVEKSVAEVIVIGLFLIVFLSSCGGTYELCPAYSEVELNQEDYHASINCENCDEVD